MTLNYELTEDDRLQNLLFTASKSEVVKKTLKRSWVVNSLLMFILCLLFFITHNRVLGYYFLILGIIFACFFYSYLRWKYRKKLIKHVQQAHIGNLPCITTFTYEFMETEGSTGSTKIYLAELKDAYETGEYFFLRFKTGSTLIIPKNQIDVNLFKNELLTILNRLKIRLIPELNWKWK